MESMKIAFDSLRANKLRSALTMLGIIVGIFSIITISTIITMLQTSIEEGVSQLGQNTFQIQKYPAITEGRHGRRKYRNRKDITLKEFKKLQERLVDAKFMGAEQWQFGKIIKRGNIETNPVISISGITIGSQPTNDWNAETGRLINENDIKSYQRVVVLGVDVAKKIFKYEDPINKELKVDGHKMRVIGVLEKSGSAFGQSRDNFVVMPITTFQSFYGKRSRSISITVMAHDKESYNTLIEKAIVNFRIIRKVSPTEEEDFSIFSNESILGRINDMTSSVRIGAIAIATIALLASGIGIMNIMLVSVTERTREIGIRKAIGAKKFHILWQFLIEATVLCQIGGLIGIILGVISGNLVGSLMNAAIAFPLDWVIIGVTICLFIGLSFGTYPAYKAANLDPIEALRYE